MLGQPKVYCIKEWLIPEFIELTSLDKTSSLVIFTLGICMTSRALKLEIFSLVKETYFCSNGSLVFSSSLTWDSCESVYNFTSYAPISNTNMVPTMKTSYSTWLLVVVNSKCKDTSMVNPTSLSNKRLTLLPLLLDNPYVKTVHVELGSRGSMSFMIWSLQTLEVSVPYFVRRIYRIKRSQWTILSYILRDQAYEEPV